MTRKFAGIPVWAWVAVLAVGGYLYYRHARGGEEEPNEGFYPTSGAAPPSAGEGGSAPGGGVANLAEELGALEGAGFVPAGSEAAKGEREVLPGIGLGIEEAFGEYLNRLMNPGAPAGTPRREGKGRKGRASRRRKPKPPRTDHRPRHLHTPSHAASKHPRQRIAVGPARQVRPRPPRRRRRR